VHAHLAMKNNPNIVVVGVVNPVKIFHRHRQVIVPKLTALHQTSGAQTMLLGNHPQFVGAQNLETDNFVEIMVRCMWTGSNAIYSHPFLNAINAN